MEPWAVILLVFISLGAFLILIALLLSHKLKANLRLPGQAELSIDAERQEGEAPRLATQEQRGLSKRAAPKGSSSGASPRYYLEMRQQKGKAWRYILDGRKVVYIGRREDSDLRLGDPAADTRQAVIYWENHRYKINNLSSRTPTKVNGKTVSKQNLGDGNTIELGRTRLIFRDHSRHH